MNVTITPHDDLEFKLITLRSGNNIYIKAGIIAIDLLLCHLLFAQPESRLFLSKHDSIQLMRYNLYNNLQIFPLTDSEATFQSVPFDFNNSNFLPIFNLGRNQNRSFSFSQDKYSSDMPGLGWVELYSNQFTWNAGSNIKMDFGAGLAMQNTIMNLDVPNYQLSFKGTVEYAYNDWITVYLYGQYLTAPLNKPDDYFDPFMYHNPLFLQNEVGAGIYTTYKKSRIDLQIFSIYGSDFQNVKPVHSKLRIGF